MPTNINEIKNYLEKLPIERKEALEAVRKIIKKSLPKGYQETIQYGMITYVVPLKAYPKGYLDKKDSPLPYVSIVSQKSHMAVYLMNLYADKKINEWFTKAYKASGKKMDIGKSCIRFKKLEDLPLDLIGEAIAKTSVDKFIKLYEEGRPKKK